jgi:hypothetical protein
MKLQRVAKEAQLDVQPKWYEEGIVVHDVTGDFDILIVRIIGEDTELKGLWLERKDETWNCLQEEVDAPLVELVLKNPKVVEHLEKTDL